MEPTRDDVMALVEPLLRISLGIERARRRALASSLAVLRVVAARQPVRPSEIAAALDVHQSSITRQVHALAASGMVAVEVDPADRRSFSVTLTDAGREESARLTEIGLDRFVTFLAGWSADDVQTLGRLLSRLEASIAEVKQREQAAPERVWRARP
jgi:DNA-binding MarR family transcriptional regulator